MGFDPAGYELENFRVDWLADRTAVGPRPGRGGVGAEQVAEVAGHVAFEGPLGEAADLRHVLRRYLNILPAGDRKDGNRDAGQRRARVVGEEVAPPAGVDPEARIRMTSPVDDLMRATRLRWVRMMSVRVIFRIILAAVGSRAATISVCQDRISSAGRAPPAEQDGAGDGVVGSQFSGIPCPFAVPDGEQWENRRPWRPASRARPARRSSILARRYSPPLAPTPRLSIAVRRPGHRPGHRRRPCPPRSGASALPGGARLSSGLTCRRRGPAARQPRDRPPR